MTWLQKHAQKKLTSWKTTSERIERLPLSKSACKAGRAIQYPTSGSTSQLSAVTHTEPVYTYAQANTTTCRISIYKKSATWNPQQPSLLRQASLHDTPSRLSEEWVFRQWSMRGEEKNVQVAWQNKMCQNILWQRVLCRELCRMGYTTR